MIKDEKDKQIKKIYIIDEDNADLYFAKAYFLDLELKYYLRRLEEQKRLCYERSRMKEDDKDVKHTEHKTAIILHAMWNDNYFWHPEHRLMDWKAKFSNQKDQYRYWHDF